MCLFSYGQTGAGKTHTMQGTSSADGRGITPRALEQVPAPAALSRSFQTPASLTPPYFLEPQWMRALHRSGIPSARGKHAAMLPVTLCASRKVAAVQILAAVAALREQGWTYDLAASYLEVYNETLRDLLAPPMPGKGGAARTLEHASIKHDANGVADLMWSSFCCVHCAEPAASSELNRRHLQS